MRSNLLSGCRRFFFTGRWMLDQENKVVNKFRLVRVSPKVPSGSYGGVVRAYILKHRTLNRHWFVGREY